MNRRKILGAALLVGCWEMIRPVFGEWPSLAWGQEKSPTGKGASKKGQPAKGSGAKGAVEKKEEVVRWPSDLSKLQGLEVDHVPILEVSPPAGKEDTVELSVKVGMTPHEMTPDHFIQRIQIWIDENKRGEIQLFPKEMLPRCRVTLVRRPSMQIMVRVECNRHGIWANRLVLP
jgi:desulfoferrodoxin-like iron-binding protein